MVKTAVTKNKQSHDNLSSGKKNLDGAIKPSATKRLISPQQEETAWQKILSFLSALWTDPKVRIIFFLILSRIFLIIFTHWGIDFDFYLDIVQKVATGQRLYTDIITTHMPLVDLLYLLMYLLCPWKESIIALRIFMKLPFLLCDIGIALVVMSIIEKECLKNHQNKATLSEEEIKKITRIKMRSGYLVAFSLPLIFQTAGGRYDSLMIFCFSMMIFCLQREDWFSLGFFAALGSSAKYIGIISLPFILVWLKKDKILPLLIGLALGLLPVYPFLLIHPVLFLESIFLRTSHIAYGFSLWHALYIIWNGFQMKYVGTIDETYQVADEPWFVQKLYLPLFILLYVSIWFFYLLKNRPKYKKEEISKQNLPFLVNIVFLPLFIFSLTFKAINIQVLAWFTPYIALLHKRELLVEFSFLTIIHGAALVLFTITADPTVFSELITHSAAEGTISYYLFISPLLWLQTTSSTTVWVGVVFLTIIWYLIRTTIELMKSSNNIILKEETN